METHEIIRRLDKLLDHLAGQGKWTSVDTIIAAMNKLSEIQLDEIRRLGT